MVDETPNVNEISSSLVVGSATSEAVGYITELSLQDMRARTRGDDPEGGWFIVGYEPDEAKTVALYTHPAQQQPTSAAVSEAAHFQKWNFGPGAHMDCVRIYPDGEIFNDAANIAILPLQPNGGAQDLAKAICDAHNACAQQQRQPQGDWVVDDEMVKRACAAYRAEDRRNGGWFDACIRAALIAAVPKVSRAVDDAMIRRFDAAYRRGYNKAAEIPNATLSDMKIAGFTAGLDAIGKGANIEQG